jgi:nicotinic acid phosphoribosyltransferase
MIGKHCTNGAKPPHLPCLFKRFFNPSPEKQRWAYLCEFEASLAYIENLRPDTAT